MRILYKGKVLHEDLTPEECAEILDNMSEQIYDGKVDPLKLKLTLRKTKWQKSRSFDGLDMIESRPRTLRT